MPRYLRNNKRVPNEKIQMAWFQIPVKNKIGYESYLIPPRVADYIELLEKQIKILPKL